MPRTKERSIPVATPERFDDPFRPIRFRIYRDHAYEPSNVEARVLCDRIRALEIERDKLNNELRERL